jgi:drug/metabolite transporter (DMT)-like permease
MTFFAFLAVIIKSIIYGSSIFFTGRLTESVDVLDVLSLRFLISFVLIWLLKITRILKINVGVRDFFRRGKDSSHVRTILLAALFEPVLYMFFETLGISMSTGIMTAVILSLGPIFSCVTEMLFLKERSTTLQKIFLGIGIFGVISRRGAISFSKNEIWLSETKRFHASFIALTWFSPLNLGELIWLQSVT